MRAHKSLIRWSMAGLLIAAVSAPGIVVSSESASFSSEVHDVKYFFDHIEPYRQGMPRFGTTQNITVRGKLVTFAIQRRCGKPPCTPGRGFGLRDANDKKFMIQMFETSPLLESLKIGRVYTLTGILEKGVDRGRKKVFIFNFRPKKRID